MRKTHAALPRAEFVHGLDHRDYVIDGSLRKNAMAQIKNMARLAGGAFENLFHSEADLLR
jgi:hypothetical protein